MLVTYLTKNDRNVDSWAAHKRIPHAHCQNTVRAPSHIREKTRSIGGKFRTFSYAPVRNTGMATTHYMQTIEK